MRNIKRGSPSLLSRPGLSSYLGAILGIFLSSPVALAADYSGTEGNDLITVSRCTDAVCDGNDVVIKRKISDQLIITQTLTDALEVKIEGLGGDDEVTIDVENGGLIEVPIFFDGGIGNDRLKIVGTPAVSIQDIIYNPGPSADGGTLQYLPDEGSPMTVYFANLEPVLDSVPSANLTVNGTGGDNTFSYEQRTGGNGLVRVDGFETFEFTHKLNLNLNGISGQDTFLIGTFSAPDGLHDIHIDGGSGGALNQIVVNGNAVKENFEYWPGSAGNGRVMMTGLDGAVFFSRIGQVTIDGKSDETDDQIAVRTQNGPDRIQLKPGDRFDDFMLTVASESGQESGVPLKILGIGAQGILTLLDGTVQATEDTLEYDGTEGSDHFELTTLGLRLNTQATVAASGVGKLMLNGFDGSDTFTVPTSGLIELIQINGGAGADIVETLGAGGNLSVNPKTLRLDEEGGGVVEMGEVDEVRIDGTNNPLIGLFGDPNDNNAVEFTALGPDAAKLEEASRRVPFLLSNVQASVASFLSGTDNLISIQGTDGNDRFSLATGNVVTSGTGKLGIAPTGAALVELNGKAGNDAFDMTPSTIPFLVDGGRHAEGDTLTFDALGNPVLVTDSSIATEGFSTLSYFGIENIRVENSVVSNPPPGGTVAFKSSVIVAAEEGGIANIEVVRSGDGIGTMSVQYAIDGGSGVAGEDYTPVAGTLSWANGETGSKSFSVPILDDKLVEADEIVRLKLLNPDSGVGGFLGGPSDAMILIRDDDDQDHDGILNSQDNCPFVYNPGQHDRDGNGVGDACEKDGDGDGIEDTQDNCPEVGNADQADSDADGVGDACESTPPPSPPPSDPQPAEPGSDGCNLNTHAASSALSPLLIGLTLLGLISGRSRRRNTE